VESATPSFETKNTEQPARAEVWRPIDHIRETFRKNQQFSTMDYAVREHVKKQLTGHLSFHMDTLVKKGLTYEELLEIQKELELCPSVLEFYPGKKSWFSRLWSKATLLLSFL
jgi:hypothetical protein